MTFRKPYRHAGRLQVLHVCGFRILFFSFQWLSWKQPGPGLLIAEAIQGFKALGTFTVFFSYLWLSWGQAGPDAIQVYAMTESLVALRRRPGATLFSVLASEVPRTRRFPWSLRLELRWSMATVSAYLLASTLRKRVLRNSGVALRFPRAALLRAAASFPAHVSHAFPGDASERLPRWSEPH